MEKFRKYFSDSEISFEFYNSKLFLLPISKIITPRREGCRVTLIFLLRI